MMKRVLCTVAVAGTTACVAISASAVERIRPGTWEQTVNIA
jgi:hypothetical protein